MREIKFRAWNKERKSKHSVSQINWYDEYIWVDEYASGTGERFKLYDVELMQYTGLKDKNGKEIYEGDILKVAMNGEEKEWINREVIWKWNGFWLEVTSGDFVPLHRYSCEIIGNIYENPELIK